MSTKNLDMSLFEDLRSSQDKVIADAEARARQLAARSDDIRARREGIRQERDEDRRRLAIIGRLQEQRAEDSFSQLDEELDAASEEADQIRWILSGQRDAPIDETPPPDVQSDASPEPEPPEDPEPVEEPEEVPATTAASEPEDRTKLQIPWVWILTGLAALITLVVMSRNLDTILGWGAGDESWKDNGFVRFVALVVPPLLVGYLVWAYASSWFNDRDK